MAEALDTLAPHFRQAMEQWPDAPTLRNHYYAVLESWDGTRHGLVETVRSFLECVCLTILGEYGKRMSTSSPSTTEIFVEALRLLGLQNTQEGGNLSRVLSAHNKLADALSDMRNENGPIAHGKDGFLDFLTANQVRIYLLTADTLIALLLAALKGTEPDLKYTREPYERFLHLHKRIDASVSVETTVDYDSDTPVIVVNMSTGGLPDGVELRIEPSRLLYAIDRTAYIEILSASAEKTGEEEVKSVSPVTEAPIISSKEVAEPHSEIITTYNGYLLPLADEFRQYIGSLNLPSMSIPLSEGEFINSLLATAEANMGIDWRKRDSFKARMKVALRRTLTKFGLADDVAKICAEHLMEWFRTIGLPNEDEGGN